MPVDSLLVNSGIAPAASPTPFGTIKTFAQLPNAPSSSLRLRGSGSNATANRTPRKERGCRRSALRRRALHLAVFSMLRGRYAIHLSGLGLGCAGQVARQRGSPEARAFDRLTQNLPLLVAFEDELQLPWSRGRAAGWFVCRHSHSRPRRVPNQPTAGEGRVGEGAEHEKGCRSPEFDCHRTQADVANRPALGVGGLRQALVHGRPLGRVRATERQPRASIAGSSHRGDFRDRMSARPRRKSQRTRERRDIRLH